MITSNPSSLAVCVIVTVRNEQKTINSLFASLVDQTTLPAEVVIIDAASSDQTVEFIEKFQKTNPPFNVVYESFQCNRSIGRNRAISLATSPLIAITDAGCLPRPSWIAELVKAHVAGSVVAGYAVGVAKTAFQEAVVPYLLVMPDRVNPKTYLPATRSMLIEKETWKQVGGFNEKLNTSEDFVFAVKIRESGVPIIFTADAVVDWVPPTSLTQFAKTIVSFATCDIRAGILRPKVLTVYGRYLLGALFYFALLNMTSPLNATVLVILGVAGYSLWAVSKNAKYVNKGKYWLPILQCIADGGVMIGTGWGAVRPLP